VELGGDEGVRQAALLGATLELVRADAGPARAASTGVAAVVSAHPPEGAGPAPGGAAILCIAPARDATPPGTLAVASSIAARAAALARWRASAADAAAVREPRVVDWDGSLVRYGAAQLNERYRRRFGHPMDEGAWTAWLALKVALETAIRAGTDAPERVAARLRAATFDGHKGAVLRFDPSGVLVQPVYVVDTDHRVVGEVRP
jgi:hypothetical protein